MASDDILETSKRPYANQVVASTTPVALGSAAVRVTELIIQASNQNGTYSIIGTEAVQCFELAPGQSVVWPVENPALLWGKSMTASPVTINVIGRYEGG